MSTVSRMEPPEDRSIVPFGRHLAAAMDEAGPLCVGIDPHPTLLSHWGVDDTPAGLERFSRTVVEASRGADGTLLAAALKPQVALFERHGSAGMAVLERTLADARGAGVLTIADAKRGDIGSTMAGYALAWLDDASPLAADSVTLSPYLGYGSLRPAIELAAETGRGVFVLALTSNPEGASVQHARRSNQLASPDQPDEAEQMTVAGHIVERAAADNSAATAPDRQADTTGRGSFGPVGLVVGATVAETARELGIDLAGSGAALLAPGYGTQGATAESMRTGFGPAWSQVLVNSSRAVLACGPDLNALRKEVRRTQHDLN